VSNRIIKQPNGLLARFSDIVDNFTHYDMTPEEAIEVILEDYRGTAVDKVQRGMDDIIPWGTMPGHGLSRWEDCIESIRIVHGKKKARGIVTELSQIQSKNKK